MRLRFAPRTDRGLGSQGKVRGAGRGSTMRRERFAHCVIDGAIDARKTLSDSALRPSWGARSSGSLVRDLLSSGSPTRDGPSRVRCSGGRDPSQRRHKFKWNFARPAGEIQLVALLVSFMPKRVGLVACAARRSKANCVSDRCSFIRSSNAQIDNNLRRLSAQEESCGLPLRIRQMSVNQECGGREVDRTRNCADPVRGARR